MRKAYEIMKAHEKVIAVYITSLCTVYYLFQADWYFFGFPVKTLLLLLFSLIAMSMYTFFLKRIEVIRRRKNWLDNILYLSFAVSVLHFLSCLFTQQKDFETDILIISMISMYFVISHSNKFYYFYFDFLLGASTLLYGLLLYHFLVDAKFMFGIRLLIRSKQELAGLLILTITVSVLRYISSRKLWKSRFFLFLSGVGSLLLFINQEMLSIVIVGFLFLIIPVILQPTAEMMKKNMIAGFVYFFLLSNMSLLTLNSNIFQNEIIYNMTSSIYIDLVLCIIGALCMYYLEKIPEESNPKNICMPKLQRICKLLLGAVGIITLAILPHMNVIENKMIGIGSEPWELFISAMKESMQINEGIYADIMQQYGIIGTVILTAILLWCMKSIGFAEMENNVGVAILRVISVIAILQMLFMTQFETSIVFYVMFIIFAVYSNQRKRNVNEKKSEN